VRQNGQRGSSFFRSLVTQQTDYEVSCEHVIKQKKETYLAANKMSKPRSSRVDGSPRKEEELVHRSNEAQILQSMSGSSMMVDELKSSMTIDFGFDTTGSSTKNSWTSGAFLLSASCFVRAASSFAAFMSAEIIWQIGLCFFQALSWHSRLQYHSCCRII
jgi:hypothetical protein